MTRTPQAEAPAPGGEDEPDFDERKEFEKREYEALQDMLEEILVEAFAVVREAGRRVLKMRHFDVQLIGGIVVSPGTYRPNETGEGKTLVDHSSFYLNGSRTRRSRRYGQRLPRLPPCRMDGQDLPLWAVGRCYRERYGRRRTSKRLRAANITYGTNNESASTTFATT